MCMKHNALSHALQYPCTAKAVDSAFYIYVDDGITVAHSADEAIELQCELQSFFLLAGFLL